MDKTRKNKPPISAANHNPHVTVPVSKSAVLKGSDWIGSMRDSVEILDDIISPANEESEWEALRD